MNSGNKERADVPVTDLTFLNGFCKGNDSRREKYIHMYIDATSQNLKMIDEALDDRDFLKVKHALHTLKTHFAFMGMHETRALVKRLEIASDQNMEIEQWNKAMGTIQEAYYKSIEELRT